MSKSSRMGALAACLLVLGCEGLEAPSLAVKKCNLGFMNCEEHELECDDKAGRGKRKCTQDEFAIEFRVLNPSSPTDLDGHYGTVRGEPKTLYFEIENVTADPVREFSINLPDPDRLGKSLEIVDSNCPYKKNSTDEFRLPAGQSCQFGVKLTPMDHPDLAYGRINELDVSGEISVQGSFKKKRNENSKSKVGKKGDDDKGYIDQRVRFDSKLVHGVAASSNSSATTSASSSSSSSSSSTCGYSGSWASTTEYKYQGIYTTVGHGFTATTAGIFASGMAADGSGTYHWVVIRSTDGGTTWSLVDDYQYAANQDSVAYGLFSTTAGVIFAVGQSANASGYKRWIVRKSSDGGSTWTTVDDFNYAGAYGDAAHGGMEATDGSLYVVGLGKGGGAGTDGHWIVRKSTDSGSSWATVDDYQHTANKNSLAYSITQDSSGSIYVAGQGSSGVGNAIIRKYDGSSWSVVDSYQQTSGKTAYALSIIAPTSGTIYWTGPGWDNTDVAHLITRKSSNSGSTFSTLDDYQYPASGVNSIGIAIYYNSNAGLFVSAVGAVAGATIIRKSTNEGNSWADVYSDGNNTSSPGQFGIDSSGNIYVTTGGSAIRVKKLSCN